MLRQDCLVCVPGTFPTLLKELGHIVDVAKYHYMYTVKIICKRLPYLGATELHPIRVNVYPDICVPG